MSYLMHNWNEINKKKNYDVADLLISELRLISISYFYKWLMEIDNY
jgi:hypothetical protein